MRCFGEIQPEQIRIKVCTAAAGCVSVILSEASVAKLLDPDSSRQGQSMSPSNLSFESRLIRRSHLNRYPASGSLGQIRPHQPRARHSFPIGHLLWIGYESIMYEALSLAVCGRAFDRAFLQKAALCKKAIMWRLRATSILIRWAANHKDAFQ